jgi:hypothetical protein
MLSGLGCKEWMFCRVSVNCSSVLCDISDNSRIAVYVGTCILQDVDRWVTNDNSASPFCSKQTENEGLLSLGELIWLRRPRLHSISRASRGGPHRPEHHQHREDGIRQRLPAPLVRMPSAGRRGDTEARQQKVRREIQHSIYFWNIQMQHLQHTSKDRRNTRNMYLKHLQKHLKRHLRPL